MLTDNARRLRKNQTDAERVLWSALRNRALGAKFYRQRPMRPYIVDFACIERRLVIEVDGGQHLDSESDAFRDAWLECQGFRVLRCWNNEVLTNLPGVLENICQALESPSPQPSSP